MAETRTSYVHKRLPLFQPEHARVWIEDVKAAFAERGWTENLIYPPLTRREPSTAPSTTPSTPASDASTTNDTNATAAELERQRNFDKIDIQAISFIKQALDYQHRYGLEHYKTSSELVNAINIKYNSFSQEDEIRLEQTLMDLKKSREKSIDSHISSFENLLSRIMASDTSGKWNDGRRNATFLRTLTHAPDRIEAKAWQQFHAYIGTTLFNVSPDILFSQARSWYETNVLPELSDTPVISDPNAHVLATQSSGYPPRNWNNNHHNNGNFNGNSSGNNGNFNGNSSGNNGNFNGNNPPAQPFPKDDNAWCDYHKKTGHHTNDCIARKKDPSYRQWKQQFEASKSNKSTEHPRAAAVRAYCTTPAQSSNLWLYDSCATNNMTDNRHAIHDLVLFDDPINVFGVGKSAERVLGAIGSGTVILSSSECDITHPMFEVLYVPDLGESIISKQCARLNSLRTTMDDDENFILRATSGFKATTRNINGMESFPTLKAISISQSPYQSFAVHCASITTPDSIAHDSDNDPTPVTTNASNPNPNVTSTVTEKDPRIWHQRLAHTASRRIAQVIDIKIPSSLPCDPCILGKMTSTPYASVDDKSSTAIYRVYIDHCGPIKPISFAGNQYALTIRDEATGYTWVYFMAKKNAKSVISVMKVWIPNVERQSGNKIKIIRTDDAEEFKSVNEQYLQPLGIEHETTAGYASSSNGVVERVHRTLFDMARSTIFTSHLPSQFWPDAVKNACYILNRLPSSSNVNNVTPYELWFGNKPSYNHIRVFGCIAHHRLPIEIIGRSHKVDPRAVKCIMLGHIGNKMYKLYDLDNQRVRKSRSVTFHETEFSVISDFKTLKIDNTPLSFGFDDYPDNEPVEDEQTIAVINPPVNVDNDGFIMVQHGNKLRLSTSQSQSQSTANVNPFSVLSDDDDSDDDEEPPPTLTSPTSPAPPASSATVPESSLQREPDSGPTTSQNPIPEITTSTPGAQSMLPEPEIVSTEPTSVVTAQPVPPTPQSIVIETNESTSISHTSPGPSQPQVPQVLQIPQTPQRPAQQGARTSSRTRIPTEKAQAAEEALKRKNAKQNRNVRTNAVTTSYEPKSYLESQFLEDADKWETATLQEIYSLDELGVWELVPRPHDRKVLRSRFVYRIKDIHTDNPRYKARLVARGFEEVKGLDYTDTFSPVVKPSSIRTILSITAAHNRLLHQFDVKNAYANSNASGESYMEQPEGFEDPSHPPPDWVLKIIKGLYGRHSSGKEWYDTLCDTLINDIGFIRSEIDPCVFTSKQHSLILAVYVDDFLVSASDSHEIAWLLKMLNKRFETRDMGPVKRFLGIDFYRPDSTGSIFINQGVYIRQILEITGMSNCNPTQTPLNHSTKLHKRQLGEEAADVDWYRMIIGKFMHLLYTRADIASAVSKLAQYLSDPSEIHAREAKHLLRYLKGTTDHGIEYSADNTSPIIAYSDASFDDDFDTSRSTSGFVLMYNGGSISHSSKKQPVVALSSMESEYIALSETTREAMFLQQLLEDINIPSLDLPNDRIPVNSKKKEAIEVLTDSQAAHDHIVKNLSHSRTKHIRRRFNFTREAHNQENIELKRIPATEQVADICTKILGPIAHERALMLLNMKTFQIPI
jgi:transposase InsO family protein